MYLGSVVITIYIVGMVVLAKLLANKDHQADMAKLHKSHNRKRN
jgi:hypothetical protein